MNGTARRALCLVLLCTVCIVAASCAKQVTARGTPVQDQLIVTAAQSLAIAENVLASVPIFLVRAHQRGAVPTHVLQDYQQHVVPVAQAALDSGRQALLAYYDSKDADDLVQLNEALAVLQGLVQHAASLLQRYGA